MFKKSQHDYIWIYNYIAGILRISQLNKFLALFLVIQDEEANVIIIPYFDLDFFSFQLFTA